jgi:hypothetical protein
VSKEYVHRGKKRFWSGKVDTLCGLVFAPDCDPEGGVFFQPSVTCPACKAALKAGKRL